MKNEVLQVSQSSVAQALAADYLCIYYVNVDNDKFIEYSSSPEYRALGLPTMGDDIISFARNNFEEVIYGEDQELFLENFVKERIIASLDAHGSFALVFRMMFGNVPTYVNLKVTRMIEKEAKHVVIGISSVDEQVRSRLAYEAAHQASMTYSSVAQALAGDYFSIYVVDPQTDRFIEYSATEEYDRMGVEKEGGDFFGLSRRNIERLIHDDDRDRIMKVFTKERIMSILERDGSFTMKYRLMVDENPTWVSMKATLLDDKDGRHIIIGTNNISAQMNREEEYKKQVEEARTSARNDFLANMSHDIRTPMNAIVGYTNIAKSHEGIPDAVMDVLNKIGSSSHFLLSLINDVLDISKIESGKMQLSPGRCDLNDIFRRIEDITALQAKNKSLKITYDRSTIRHTLVEGDELRIEQVLINIISNAIKYTPEGKTVDIIAEEEPGEGGKNMYTFIVRDTGIGISREYLPYIFESFTREEKTTVNRIQGTGLGLAITARVVELMGGAISVKSEPGEGTEFTVKLTLPALESEEETAPEETDGGELSGRRILLAEDNEINAEIAVMTLEQFGIETELAKNGRIALDMIKNKGESAYDAVLMDIQMPEMNGLEATRAIRALGGGFASLPIIAMSANAYDEDVRDCLEAGMNAHVPKPFDPDELIRLIKKNILK
ncbi:MAG: response regulator [Clostridia bacterium]|nr:response regulator [Clostridia bacterium]